MYLRRPYFPEMKRYVLHVDQYDQAERKYVIDRVINSSSLPITFLVKDGFYYSITLESFDSEERRYIGDHFIYQRNYSGEFVKEWKQVIPCQKAESPNDE